MNAFRLAGDMTHLLSIIVLLLKIRTTKSCSGISLKTQELYVIVFLARYLDLFSRYVSFYNTVMKLVFIGTSICIVWYMRLHKVVKQTYNKDEDTFRHYFLIPPCFLLAMLVHRSFTFMEIMWTFSLYLEAVAILPQLLLLQRYRNIDNLAGTCLSSRFFSHAKERAHGYNYILNIQGKDSPWSYLVAKLLLLPPIEPSILVDVAFWSLCLIVIGMGAYRAVYLVNWIYRFFWENHQYRWIPWLSGLVQTGLYADFFYYYIKSWKNNEKLKLPA